MDPITCWFFSIANDSVPCYYFMTLTSLPPVVQHLHTTYCKLCLMTQHRRSRKVPYLKKRFLFPSTHFVLYLMCPFKVFLSGMVIKYLMSVFIVCLQVDTQVIQNSKKLKYKFQSVFDVTFPLIAATLSHFFLQNIGIL